MSRIAIVTVLLAGATLVACEGARNNSSWMSPTSESDVATASTAPTTGSTAITSGKGVGPVDHVDMASLDESKADLGAQVFQAKCTPCHKIEERYIGPALAGVTQRRQPEWILNMILNPEVMIKQDPTAMALMAQYIAPMANQHLTREEAECVLVYFREHDKKAAEGDAKNDQEDTKDEKTSVNAANGQ